MLRFSDLQQVAISPLENTVFILTSGSQEVASFVLGCINHRIIKRKDRIIGLGESIMKISYKKLWILLIEKDISPATLRKDLSIATGTMTKLRKNEEVALSVLLRICDYLNCNIGDICDAVKDEAYEIGEI